MTTLMLFGDSNIEDGLVAIEMRDVHGFTPVGSQENPAGVKHEGYQPARNALDFVTNAAFPLHMFAPNNFETAWVSGFPNPADIPDWVVVAFGTNHLRPWLGFTDFYYYAQMTASHSGQIIRYFRRIWPTAKIVATLFVDGHDDPGIVAWDAYEGPPWNAPVGTGRDFWLAQRDAYAAEFERFYAPMADAYARFDLDGSVAFTDDVHMTAAGITEYANVLNDAILGLGTFVPPIFVEPNKITIFGQILDAAGAPVEGAELKITPPKGGLFAGTPPRLLIDEDATVLSDSNGLIQMEFFETETISESVLVELTVGSSVERSKHTELPNQTSISLEDLLG